MRADHTIGVPVTVWEGLCGMGQVRRRARNPR